jgi:hypothetical protein
MISIQPSLFASKRSKKDEFATAVMFFHPFPIFSLDEHLANVILA